MILPCVYTIGYEGKSLEDFIRILREHDIDVIIDVRELPISRKKGFSKNQLSQTLEEARIQYEPARSLGTPRDVRNRYRATGDRDVFAEDYAQVLRDHQPELQELLQKAQQEKICLLCFEQDSADCHRSLLAEELRRMSGQELSIVDL